jgi:hypothetical protein
MYLHPSGLSFFIPLAIKNYTQGLMQKQTFHPGISDNILKNNQKS